MKLNSIKALISEEEVLDYVGTLWRTPEFKKSHDNDGGYVHSLIKRFAKVPRFFFEMSDPDLENSHFSSWWNAISIRDYQNDAISDLYYLHEIYHATTMKYDENITFNEWFRKMSLNELYASVQSEVWVYFMLPGLREKSFEHEIWADRFLAEPRFNPYYKEPIEDIFNAKDLIRIELAREKVMQAPIPYDFIELQIAHYGRQNLDWCIMWKDERRAIERHMREFMELSKVDREAATKKHLRWIVTTALNTPTEEMGKSDKDINVITDIALDGEINAIPFKKLAIEFANLVEENKKKYGNHLLL